MRDQSSITEKTKRKTVVLFFLNQHTNDFKLAAVVNAVCLPYWYNDTTKGSQSPLHIHFLLYPASVTLSVI